MNKIRHCDDIRISEFSLLSGKSIFRAWCLIFIILVLILACSNVTAGVDVTVTTTLLGSVVKDVGGKNVNVHVLIAPGSCPGHYDLSPGDIKILSASKLVLKHGYEKFIDRAVDSLGRKKPAVKAINVKGSWLIPSNYVSAARKIFAELVKLDPKNKKEYAKALSNIEKDCKKIEDDIAKKSRLYGFSGIRVLCSNQQCEFIEWLGFSVIASYGRSEELTPQLLHTITRLGRQQKVRAVIDNLQSGPTTGKELAKDIGAAHIVLSNFPGGFPETQTWKRCFNDNLNRIIRGIVKK